MHRIRLMMELYAGLLISRSTLSYRDWLKILEPCTELQARAVVLRLLHGLENWEIGERLTGDDNKVNAQSVANWHWRAAIENIRKHHGANILELAA